MKKTPFPQANNLERIYEIFKMAGTDGLSGFEVSEILNLAYREAIYYMDALRYFDLFEKIKLRYFLTNDGYHLNNLPIEFQYMGFIIKVIEQPIIKQLYSETSEILDKKEKLRHISEKIKNTENLSQSTTNRRASTIMSWLSQLDEFKDKVNE